MLRVIRSSFLVLFLMAGFLRTTYAMKNPAAVYCKSLGYEYVIEVEDSGEKGLCVLPDGQKVGGWDFLKGVVGEEYSYCKQQGLDMKTVDDPDTCIVFLTEECAVCIFNDGTEKEVTELMGLSFTDPRCGDEVCHFSENFSTCPADCPSGSYDNFCDEIIDGLCDPDCVADADCSSVDIDSDAICNGPLKADYPNCEPDNVGDSLVEESLEKAQEEWANDIFTMREGNCRPNETVMAYCENQYTMETCETFGYCNWKGEWCEPYFEKFEQCSAEETIDSCTLKEYCVWYGGDCTLCIAGPDNCPHVYNPDQADSNGDGIGDACDSDTITTTTMGSTTTTTERPSLCPIERIYGEHSEETELLGYFRDNLLSATPEGQEMVRLYYQWSPVIVKAMEGDEEFKEEIKEMIDGVLELIE